MTESDLTEQFSRIITQVKALEYERGWREAMEAIQRAARDLIERAPVASLGAAASDEAAQRRRSPTKPYGLLPVSRTPSLGVMMEPEVGYATSSFQSGVQA